MNLEEKTKMIIPRWVTQMNYDAKQVERIKNNLVEYPGFELINNDEINESWESTLPFLFKDNQQKEERSLLLYNGIPVIPGPKLESFMDWYYEESGYPIGGRDFMYDIIKEMYIGVSRRDIERYIKNRMKEKKFVLKRRIDDLNPLVANRPMQIWEIKIVDMDYAQYNPGLTVSNFPYLVLVQDKFTQFIWAAPLIRKEVLDQICKLLNNIYKDIEKTEIIGTVFGNKPLIIKTNKINHKNTLLTSLKFSQCINGVRVEMKGGDHKVPTLPNNLDKDQIIHLIYTNSSNKDRGDQWEKRITRLIENELASDPIIDSYDEIIQKVINDYNEEPNDITKVSPYDAYNKETWYTIKENIYERVKTQTQKTLEKVKEQREREFKAKSLTLEEEMNERINSKETKNKEDHKKVKVIDLNETKSTQKDNVNIKEIDEFA